MYSSKHSFKAVILLAILIAVSGCSSNSVQSSKEALSWDKMPDMMINLNNQYLAEVTTSLGSFSIELFAEDVPMTVNNFIFLAREGFYDGLLFHSVIKDFLIQTGDPKGNGTGHPGYWIPDELYNDYKYEPGIVAMASWKGPNSGGSQFFICTGAESDNLNMEPNYAIFGRVKSGMDIIELISNQETENQVPLKPVIVEKITIIET